jgi:hypothetical protein
MADHCCRSSNSITLPGLLESLWLMQIKNLQKLTSSSTSDAHSIPMICRKLHYLIVAISETVIRSWMALLCAEEEKKKKQISATA